MRPRLLRPPISFWDSVSALRGRPFHNWLRSMRTSCRVEGVVGLNVFSAMTASNTRRHVDRVAVTKRDNCFLHVAAFTAAATKHFLLALLHDRVDRGDLHLREELFDRLLDL